MKASAASAKDWAMASDWTTSRSFRLSERSATRPDQAPSRRRGPNWQAVRRPRARPPSVSFRTSRVWAIIVSQLPTWEMSWPPKKRRKFRVRSERKVFSVHRIVRGLIGAPPSGWCRHESGALLVWFARACARSRSTLGGGGAGQALQDGGSLVEPDQVLGGEVLQAGGQPGGPSGAPGLQLAPAGRTQLDPGDPAIRGVGAAAHQAGGLELAHDPGDR